MLALAWAQTPAERRIEQGFGAVGWGGVGARTGCRVAPDP